MFKDQKLLVAGGTGFLGGALIRRLLHEGAYVRATHHSHSPEFSHPRLEWVRADLENAGDCAAVAADMDAVLMCAASTSGAADIVGRPLIHLTPNVVMNARMLEASYMAKVRRFLFLSSAAAYPPAGDRPLIEDDMFTGEPADVYYVAGWMKRYGEILCRTYATKLNPAMSTVVVRPSNVYGPGDKFDWQRSHVTAAIIRRVVERQRPIEIWGDGKTRRDVIYIDDFVDGALLALNSGKPHFIVNIAGGRTHSVSDILQTALEVDGFGGAEIKFDTTQPQTVDSLAVDATLARVTLGFEAKVALDDGLRRTIAWYRAQ
jgi:GDP-L-fucose synthase